MFSRALIAMVLAGAVASPVFGQQKAAVPGGPAPGASSALEAAVDKEVKGLTSDDFPEREAAVQRLQTLIADQVKQRAEIQEVLLAFHAELAQQQRALAMGGGSDEEAHAQIAGSSGLLEMERGISGWTIQAMGEPLERRKMLLDWGLTKERAPVLAHAYAQNKRVRLEGIKELAKIQDDGASWTLGRLINDPETAVRAGAMAVCWTRNPTQDIAGALWFRAVSGPLAIGEQGGASGGGGPAIDVLRAGPDGGGENMLKVDFPGGEPMEFDTGDESNEFFDSQLASDVLVHMKSPLVAQRVKTLVEERVKAGKTLSLDVDPDWTLVAHRLVETYEIKDAIPILAAEALGNLSDEMGGDMNGRPFMWSRRTMAMGTLAKLIGKEPGDFGLIRAKDGGDPRGWMWAVEMNPQQMNMNGTSDAAAMRLFFDFWKDHHNEYGVKEEPSAASIPVPRRGGRGRGGVMIDPVQNGPVPVPVPLNGPNTKFPLNPAAVPEGVPAPNVEPEIAPPPVAPSPPVAIPLPAVRGRAAG